MPKNNEKTINCFNYVKKAKWLKRKNAKKAKVKIYDAKERYAVWFARKWYWRKDGKRVFLIYIVLKSYKIIYVLYDKII